MIRRRGDRGLLATPDERIAINGVSWDQYCAVREALDHVAGLKVTYLAGMLEITSPGRTHERVKKLVARLVELFALERDVPLEGYGSMTFRRKAKERGVEPDECWCVGHQISEETDSPDIAFEVNVTSGSIDRLEVYRGLDVREVWLWRDGRFSLHELGKKGYRRIKRSRFIPELDFSILESLVASDMSQHEALLAYRDRLRRG